MLARNSHDQERVDGLIANYVVGDISETVFMVSLHRYLDIDDIRHLVILNQTAYRNSTNYRRGLYR